VTSSSTLTVTDIRTYERTMFATTTTSRAAIGFRAAVRGVTRVTNVGATTTTTTPARGRFVFTSTVVAGRKAAKIAAKSA
jgi:hypothetical protein